MVRASLVLAVVAWLPGTVPALPQADGIQHLRARVRASSRFVVTGRPVLVDFTIENVSDAPVTLRMPGGSGERPARAMGLPLGHVFSGRTTGGISIVEQSTNRRATMMSDWQDDASTPAVVLAPHASVGRTINLLDYFPMSLRAPGRYKITWAPYGGAVVSNSVFVDVGPIKQAQIVTDYGTMTVQLFFDEAPHTVANFLDLVEDGFYDNLTFHRLVAGQLIQGGCPNGDGTGIRPDGTKIPAEINEHHHDKGSVSMALLNEDANSASCQFFICYTEHPEWDERYTVFGHLLGEESYETLDRIMALPVYPDGRPKQPILIRAVRLSNVPVNWADIVPPDKTGAEARRGK